MAFASFFSLLLLLASATAAHLPDHHHHHHHHHHHRHGRGEASAVSVVGSVLCDQCFQQHFNHRTSSFLSGAKVGIECKQSKKKWGTLKLEAWTGEDGHFQIQLPPSIAHSPKRLKGCKARLLKSPDKLCSVKAEGASVKPFAAMSLKSVHGTSYVYTTGSFVFHPPPHSLNPSLCNSILRDHHHLHVFKTALSTPVQNNNNNQKDAFSSPSFPFNIPIPPIPGLIPPPPPPAAGLFPPIPFIPPIPSALTPPIPFLTPPSLPSFPPLPYVPPLPTLPLLPPLTPSQVLPKSKSDRP